MRAKRSRLNYWRGPFTTVLHFPDSKRAVSEMSPTRKLLRSGRKRIYSLVTLQATAVQEVTLGSWDSAWEVAYPSTILAAVWI